MGSRVATAKGNHTSAGSAHLPRVPRDCLTPCNLPGHRGGRARNYNLPKNLRREAGEAGQRNSFLQSGWVLLIIVHNYSCHRHCLIPGTSCVHFAYIIKHIR